jgi:hypothetical protein
MNSYHNTTSSEGTDLKRKEYKAHSLEMKILKYLRARAGYKYTPWEIWEWCCEEKHLITSVRRALSNLVKSGDLKDTRFTPEKKMERQGDWNYFWYYPKKD